MNTHNTAETLRGYIIKVTTFANDAREREEQKIYKPIELLGVV